MRWVLDRDFRDILGSELVSVTGGLLTGSILAAQEDVLLAIPGVLIIVPGFLEMRGNISGTLSSRLTAGLFLGEIETGDWRSRIILGNLFGSILLSLGISISLGLIAFLFTLVAFDRIATNLILIPVIAGVVANGIEVPLTVYATFFVFRRGHDPNNVIGPFVTSTGDVTSILALLLAVILV